MSLAGNLLNRPDNLVKALLDTRTHKEAAVFLRQAAALVDVEAKAATNAVNAGHTAASFPSHRWRRGAEREPPPAPVVNTHR